MTYLWWSFDDLSWDDEDEDRCLLELLEPEDDELLWWDCKRFSSQSSNRSKRIMLLVGIFHCFHWITLQKNLIWLKFLNFHPWKWPRFSKFQEVIAKRGSKSGPKDPKMSPFCDAFGLLEDLSTDFTNKKRKNTKSFFTVYGKSPCHAGFYVMYQNISFS